MRVLPLALILIFLAACNTKVETADIPPAKMEAILKDLQLAELELNCFSFQF